MCCLRKILGRHPTDLGVVASRLRGFVHNSPIPASADILAKASLSRPCSGRKPAARRLSRTQDPTKGQLNFFNDSLRTKTGHRSPAGLREPMRVCILCLALGLCRAASGREGCTCTCLWHAPKLTQPSHRNPGSAMSAELSVGNVTNKAAKRRQPWRASIFLCEGNYRYFKVDVETKERPRENPFFLKMRRVATTAQGGSKKKCFSNALRHTPVVLEMH